MGKLGILRRLAWMPWIVALLHGCTSVRDSGSILKGWGFASDTTAILFHELWESYETFLDISTPPATSYYGWELKLVDVRFNKVYWSAKIDKDRSNTQILNSSQWNDSTMLIDLTGEGYWLWVVGRRKPHKVNFNWNSEMENYKTGDLLSYLSGFWLHPWKNDSILLTSNSIQAIVDTKTMTVSNWSQTGDNAWTTTCNSFWWGKNGGVCLINNKQDNKPYGFILLSEKGDTLNNFTYANECAYYNDKCDINSSFFYNFIEVSFTRCMITKCNPHPAKIKEAYFSFFRYDDKWNIDREPSFWMLFEREFVDSLGNITRY
jgi:hypothetical protein